MIALADTTDPRLESWVPVAAQSDFPIQNLPFGVFVRDGGVPRIGVAIGDEVLDCHAVAQAGFFDDCCEPELLQAPLLNPLLAAGRSAWSPLRERLSQLLRIGGDRRLREAGAEHFLFARDSVEMCVPMNVGDYVDFYSSIEHATNLGRLFRPNAEALLPNWRWIPVGYHGRSSSIVIDGTPMRRPCGQRKPPDAPAPEFGPSRRLDIELEMGFVTGPGNQLGTPIAVDEAARAHLWTRARQRLERARHSSLGVSAARAVSRQVIRDDDFAVDRDPRGTRALSRGRAAPGARTVAVPAGRRAVGIRDQARGRSAKPAYARARRSARDDLADDVCRYVLERRAATRPRNGQRRGDAPRRSLRLRHDQRLRTRHPRQLHRAEAGMASARSSFPTARSEAFSKTATRSRCAAGARSRALAELDSAAARGVI